MLPDAMQESANSAYDEFMEQREIFEVSASKVQLIEAWLDDEKNEGNPDMDNRRKGLEVAEAEEKKEEAVFNDKKNVYLAILDKGADAIEANFDPSDVILAQKIDKLLEVVDDGAINAVSLFTAAGIGITRGYGEIGNEMKAILAAQALTSLVGNQKQFLIERYERMLTGTLLAIPNVAVGTYYVVAGRGKISTYKDVVEAVLDGAKVMEESSQAQVLEQKIEEAQPTAQAK